MSGAAASKTEALDLMVGAMRRLRVSQMELYGNGRVRKIVLDPTYEPAPPRAVYDAHPIADAMARQSVNEREALAESAEAQAEADRVRFAHVEGI